jgi:hypothetical protein
VNALQVNDNLPKNTQFVEGDDHMKWLTQQFPVSLRLGWLCSQSGVLSKPVNNWKGERIALSCSPCVPTTQISAVIESDEKYDAYNRYKSSGNPMILGNDDPATQGEIVLAAGN